MWISLQVRSQKLRISCSWNSLPTPVVDGSSKKPLSLYFKSTAPCFVAVSCLCSLLAWAEAPWFSVWALTLAHARSDKDFRPVTLQRKCQTSRFWSPSAACCRFSAQTTITTSVPFMEWLGNPSRFGCSPQSCLVCVATLFSSSNDRKCSLSQEFKAIKAPCFVFHGTCGRREDSMWPICLQSDGADFDAALWNPIPRSRFPSVDFWPPPWKRFRRHFRVNVST